MSVMSRRDPPEALAERGIRLTVEAAGRATAVDPFFGRRLRGLVLNRYVAAREGAVVQPARRRVGRIGRACLVGSIALALSAGGVMAASKAALPGEPLYPIKRGIEVLRSGILPSEFQDELAAYAFGQRVNELGLLVAAGDTARAAALVPDLRASYEALLALQPDGAAVDGFLAAQLSVLTSLLDRLPPQASEAIQRALENARGLPGDAPGFRGGGQERGGPAEGGRGSDPPRQPADPVEPRGAPGVGDPADDQRPEPARRTGPPPTRGPAATPPPPPAGNEPIDPEEDKSN